MWAKKTVLALKINHELIKGWSCMWVICDVNVDYGDAFSSPVSRVFHIFYSSSRDGNFH